MSLRWLLMVSTIATGQPEASPTHSPSALVASGEAGSGDGFVDAVYVSPGRSALQHWRFVVLWALIGLVAGSGYGIARHPVYSAQAPLYVGKTLSLANTSAIPGLALAATQIAGDYARLISDPDTVAFAAKQMNLKGLPGSLTASQIAQSPEIVVYAKASSQGVAVQLAEAGSAALVNSVDQVNVIATQQLAQLKSQYTQVNVALNNSNVSLVALSGEISALQGSASASSASVQARLAVLQSQKSSLQAQISTDQLESTAIGNEYQNNVSPLLSDEQIIKSLGSAGATGSDRKKRLELTVLVGTAAGFLLGVTLASSVDLRADRLRRRRSKALPAVGVVA